MVRETLLLGRTMRLWYILHKFIGGFLVGFLSGAAAAAVIGISAGIFWLIFA